MFIQKSKAFVSSLIFFLLAITPVLAGNSNPKNTVESLFNAIKNIKTGNNLSAKQKDINKKNSEIALSKLNIHIVGRKTLGKYWKKRTPQEQKSFLFILSKLFKKVAFPNSGKFFANLDIRYGTNEVKKGSVIIPITVIHKDEGEIDIEFILEQVDGNWLVSEVILDGVSMRNNLRSQFYKIINNNSYQELIRRLNKKIKDTEVDG